MKAESRPPRDLEGVRLIIVEDDAILLIDLESILRDAGAHILRLCRTVEEGVAAAEIEGLAAALLDVRLGHDTVAPVARRLGARGPFLFYTGQIGNEVLAEWPECKVIAKPARAKVIISALADLLPDAEAGVRRAH
jgi:ActR/RegA family two-component response regulator